MTTVHAYTNSQALLDVDPTTRDLRKSRAAAINIVPTTTGAMEVVDKIFPHLKGKIAGNSLRVPVPKVSIIDLTVQVKKSCSIDELNEIFRDASKKLPNIIEFSTLPLVSSDYAGNSHSVIIDSLMTEQKGYLVKIFGWYDNEWGYSCRLKDFVIAYSDILEKEKK